MNQTIRIISGLYRGKKISFPKAPGLRPTPDRVKETLFNWLMHHLREARCLDAFAGSGSLGFEALSRGAKEVVLLESSPLVFAQLKKTATTFQSQALTVLQIDALSYLKTAQPFDLLFLDPPFETQFLPECLKIIHNKGLLKENGLIYVESARPFSEYLDFFSIDKEGKAGQVYYGLLRQLH